MDGVRALDGCNARYVPRIRIVSVKMHYQERISRAECPPSGYLPIRSQLGAARGAVQVVTESFTMDEKRRIGLNNVRERLDTLQTLIGIEENRRVDGQMG